MSRASAGETGIGGIVLPGLTAGALRTEFGSYAPAFIGAGVLCVIAAVGVLPIAKRPVVASAPA